MDNEEFGITSQATEQGSQLEQKEPRDHRDFPESMITPDIYLSPQSQRALISPINNAFSRYGLDEFESALETATELPDGSFELKYLGGKRNNNGDPTYEQTLYFSKSNIEKIKDKIQRHKEIMHAMDTLPREKDSDSSAFRPEHLNPTITGNPDVRYMLMPILPMGPRMGLDEFLQAIKYRKQTEDGKVVVPYLGGLKEGNGKPTYRKDYIFNKNSFDKIITYVSTFLSSRPT